VSGAFFSPSSSLLFFGQMTSALIQLLFPVTSDDVVNVAFSLKVWFSTKDFPPVKCRFILVADLFFSLSSSSLSSLLR